MIIFEKTYDGESLYDWGRDAYEIFDEESNPILSVIPVDEYGIQKGTFTVIVKWSNDE